MNKTKFDRAELLSEIQATLKPVMDYGYALAAKLDEQERQLKESPSVNTGKFPSLNEAFKNSKELQEMFSENKKNTSS